jgi:hypothetical protein
MGGLAWSQVNKAAPPSRPSATPSVNTVEFTSAPPPPVQPQQPVSNNPFDLF